MCLASTSRETHLYLAHTKYVVSCPDPTLCEGKGVWRFLTQSLLGPWKGTWTTQLDHISVKLCQCHVTIYTGI